MYLKLRHEKWHYKKNQKCPLREFMNSGNLKLEKTLLKGSKVTLPKKTIFIYFFISKFPLPFY